MTGFTTTWVSGLAHQRRTCSAVISDAGVLQPAEVAEPGVGDRVLGEVRVEHDLPGPAPRRLGAASGCGRVQVEGLLVAGQLAHRGGPPHVERLGRPEGLELLRAGGHRGVEVEGVGEVELADDVGGAGEEVSRVSMSKCRPSAAALRRVSASSGMNRAMASSTSRSSWQGPILCATCATCASTNAAASGDRATVARAMRRARQAAVRPAVTRAQTRGSR